jgi:hypothetical protein
MLRGGGMHLEGGGPFLRPPKKKKIIIIQNPSQAQIQMKIVTFFLILYVNYCCVVEVGRRKVHPPDSFIIRFNLLEEIPDKIYISI